MPITSFAILGGDLRQCYLAEYLCIRENEVTCFGTMPFPYAKETAVIQADTLKNALEYARLVLCPIPFSTEAGFLHAPALLPSKLALSELLEALSPGQIVAGGGFLEEFLLACTKKGIVVWDFMKEEHFLAANAALTAEGLLASVILSTPFSLVGRKVLLLGYGRCGSEIARRLQGFDMELLALDYQRERLVAARMDGIRSMGIKPEIIDFSFFDIIINTIPSQIFYPSQLKTLKKQCVLYDIASQPFGFSKETIEKLKLNYIRCPGIPGKCMPQSAGELIGKLVLERISSDGF